MREYLRKLRESNSLSQQSVADRLGITRQYYQQIENGDRQKDMDISLVVQFSNLFGISPEEIIRKEQEVKEVNR